MSDIVILVTTHAKAARYLPAVREALDAFWPDRPPVRYLTDGGVEPAADIYIEDEREFVPLLAKGVARIKAEFPAATHVFHMLEDHCPLRTCDNSQFNAALREATARNFVNVAFPTYDWPWDYCDPIDRPFGEREVWKSIEIIEAAETKFGVVPLDYFRYFQIQPTIWQIDYLIGLLAAAADRGIADPWKFECMQLPKPRQHYVSSYRWPTVHHGFLAQGKINAAAIKFVDTKAGRSIRRNLIKQAIGLKSETLFDLNIMRLRVAARLARMMNH